MFTTAHAAKRLGNPVLRSSFSPYRGQRYVSSFARRCRPKTTSSRTHRQSPARGLHSSRNTNGGNTTRSSRAVFPRVWQLLKRPFVQFFRWYARQQQARPYITQLCSTPIIYCLGDYSAQIIGGGEYEVHRSISSIIIGAVISIPTYEWFMFLGRRFNYASPILSTGLKVAVNQLVYTPSFNVYFFAFHALLSGGGWAGAVERVKDTVPTSIPRSFFYWPLVTALNFTYVQPQYRAIVTGIGSVFWQSYLSWLNSKAEASSLAAKQ